MNKDKIIRDLLYNNPQYIRYLKAIKDYSKEDLWIGGGFIRTIVWDYLHHYEDHHTEFLDIDVFYYNPSCIIKDKDVEIEHFLHTRIQNARWSVKNQARMHIHHKGELQYKSLEDALMKFPDTASTIAVKLDNNDNIVIIAPYGFDDLFNLKVKPTPDFFKNPVKRQRYEQRINEKQWKQLWPELDIEYTLSHGSTDTYDIRKL